ncbi:hypothetical protein D3C87_1298230 [compost metagenome]
MQVLHWVAKPPEDITNDQVRYSLNDHLQSSALELDEQAELISQEWYYPHGGTACFAARSTIEAKYKTVRYSGKERDATGLYYYGFRYYAPWLQRWINPDPAGYVDGANLYRMTTNNPINFWDGDGLITKSDRAKRRQIERTLPIKARGMTAITKYNPELADKIKTGLDDSRNKIANAIKAVEKILNNEDDGTYSGIISDYMGNAAPPEPLLETLKSLYAFSRQYGHNSQRIVAVQITQPDARFSSPPVAFVHSHSAIKNIYINSISLKDPREYFSSTLIHEYTHIFDDLNTTDFYYINDDSTSAEYNAQLSAFDWLEGKYKLTVKNEDKEDFIEASDEPDMPSALNKYYNDREFREFVSTGNADSWSEMIASLSNRIIASLRDRIIATPQHIFV